MRAIDRSSRVPLAAEPRPSLGAEVVRLARLAMAVHMGVVAGMDEGGTAPVDGPGGEVAAGDRRRAEVRR